MDSIIPTLMKLARESMSRSIEDALKQKGVRLGVILVGVGWGNRNFRLRRAVERLGVLRMIPFVIVILGCVGAGVL